MPNTPRHNSLGFKPVPKPTPSRTPRQTPRRAARQNHDYNTIQRPQFIPQNPEKEPTATADSEDPENMIVVNNASEVNKDTDMPDIEDIDNSEAELQSTPSKRKKPDSLITIRKQKIQRKRKARAETTWTLHHFTIKLLEKQWVNPAGGMQIDRR
jgi:hypothetical protein